MNQTQASSGKAIVNFEYYSAIAPMSATFQQYGIATNCSDSEEEIYALDFNSNMLSSFKNYARNFLPKQ